MDVFILELGFVKAYYEEICLISHLIYFCFRAFLDRELILVTLLMLTQSDRNELAKIDDV